MFRKQKNREAVCYVLKRLGSCSTYGAVTKLLYIADREAIRKLGRSITGDTMCALPQGPILSIVLDRLNGSHADFRDLIENDADYQIRLIGNEEPQELTCAEIAILDAVLEEFGEHSWEALKAATHEFGEWKRYDKGRDTWSLISPADVGHALGFEPDQVEALMQNVVELSSMAELMSTLGEPLVATV